MQPQHVVCRAALCRALADIACTCPAGQGGGSQKCSQGMMQVLSVCRKIWWGERTSTSVKFGPKGQPRLELM